MMEKKEIVTEIIEIINSIAKYEFNWEHKRIDCLVAIRNKIMEFKSGDDSLGAILIYLNGMIQALKLK